MANLMTDSKATTRSSTRIRVESFFMVSDEFAGWKMTANARKCRSMALRYHSFYKEAIDEAALGLESATAEEKFDLHNRIGRTYFGWSEDMAGNVAEYKAQPSNQSRSANLENALYHFEEALKEKANLVDDDLRKKKLGRTYQLKAKIEIFLDKSQAALSSMAEATAIGRTLNDGSDSAIYFSDLVEGLGERSQWSHIINLLGMVNETQLAAKCTSKTHKLIQYAANIAGGDQGTSHVARLRQMYLAAIRTLDDARDSFSGSIRGWLAVFERSVVQNIPEAKELLYQVLDPSLGGIRWVTPASWQLSNILLEEFRLATSLDEKERIRDEMERLFDFVAELLGPEFQPEQSQISIPLSIMRRRLGPASAFYHGANATFKGCIDTLTDNLSSNDTPSFQMLAKILSLLPGLEWHAQVASSCQFYIVDMAVYEREQSSEVSVSVHRENVMAANNVVSADYYGNTAIAPNYYSGPIGQAALYSSSEYGNMPWQHGSPQNPALYSSSGGGNMPWQHGSQQNPALYSSPGFALIGSAVLQTWDSSQQDPGFGNGALQQNTLIRSAALQTWEQSQDHSTTEQHATHLRSTHEALPWSPHYGADPSVAVAEWRATQVPRAGVDPWQMHPNPPYPNAIPFPHYQQQPGWQQTAEQTSILASRRALLDAGGTETSHGPSPEAGGMEKYDVNHQWRMACTSCRKALSPRSTSYLCYFCTNSILCEECHGADEGSVVGLQTPCPAGHCHIETPVKGWKGVRDEVLVFDFGQIGFNVWLEGLKMKWEDGWKHFWAEGGE
jgi:hypothetical protein